MFRSNPEGEKKNENEKKEQTETNTKTKELEDRHSAVDVSCPSIIKTETEDEASTLKS